MNTCEKNCRALTKEVYARRYHDVQEALGWRKLTSLNLIIMQQVIRILGHGSLHMIMDLYCHVTEDTLFDAMSLMEKCV